MTQLYSNSLEKLRAIPGVEAVGVVAAVPMGGGTDSTVIRIPGRIPLGDPSNGQDQPYASYTFASAGYFGAVRTPLLRGRDFLPTDTLDAPHVTIINVAMANKFWPGEDPIGKQLGVGDVRWPARTIVGVVTDLKRKSLREPPIPEMYVPYTQNEIGTWPSMRNLQVALRASGDPASVLGGVREVMRSIDPDLPLSNIATLNELIDRSLVQPRFSMLLVGAFGALAVLLAAFGMYGAISYSVAQRTREIGTRMALGAARRSVFAMILRQGVRIAGLGVLIGVVAALAVTRLIAGFLYQIPAADPWTFGVISVLLVGVAILACYVPARRAMSVDPMAALRHE
jgi:putative ABC transport system permease protein